ncbi:MAG TPA: hypothetical protein VIK11_02460 [Tepidiformaceae bacterium]
MAPQDLALMDLEWAYGAAPAIVVVGEMLAQASLDRAAQSAAAARARMQVRYDHARRRMAECDLTELLEHPDPWVRELALVERVGMPAAQ